MNSSLKSMVGNFFEIRMVCYFVINGDLLDSKDFKFKCYTSLFFIRYKNPVLASYDVEIA